MRNPFTAVYDWMLLNYIRFLLLAEYGPVTDEERAKADFIAHGGDPEGIEAFEWAHGIE